MAVHSRARCETVPTSKGIAPYAIGIGTLSTLTLAGGPQQINAWAITVTMKRGGSYAFHHESQDGTSISFQIASTNFGSKDDTTASFQEKFGKLDASPSQTSLGMRAVLTNDTRTNITNGFNGLPMTFFAESMTSDGSAANVTYKTTQYHFRSHPGQSATLTDPWVQGDAVTIEFFNEPFDGALVKGFK